MFFLCGTGVLIQLELESEGDPGREGSTQSVAIKSEWAGTGLSMAASGPHALLVLIQLESEYPSQVTGVHWQPRACVR